MRDVARISQASSATVSRNLTDRWGSGAESQQYGQRQHTMPQMDLSPGVFLVLRLLMADASSAVTWHMAHVHRPPRTTSTASPALKQHSSVLCAREPDLTLISWAASNPSSG